MNKKGCTELVRLDGGPSWADLPDLVHSIIGSYLKKLPCRAGSDLVGLLSLNKSMRKVYLGTLEELVIRGGGQGCQDSLEGLMRAMGKLRMVEMLLEVESLSALSAALRNGAGERVESFCVLKQTVTSLRTTQDLDAEMMAAVAALPFAGLPKLRVLTLQELRPEEVLAVLEAMGPTACPLLDEVEIGRVGFAQVGALALALNARAAAGCRPLGRFSLEFDGWVDEATRGMFEQLLRSPYLARLASLRLRLSEMDSDELALLGEYLLRRGRGQLRSLELSSLPKGPVPEPFLEALRAGALAGLEGVFGLDLDYLDSSDDGAATAVHAKSLIQALAEGGGCPGVTSSRSPRDDMFFLQGVAIGAFPALESLCVDWLPEHLLLLSACLTKDKLPKLQRLGLCSWCGLEPAQYEGLCSVLKAAERGKLQGLKTLWLKSSDWTTRLMSMVLKAVEGPMLPALNKLELVGHARYGAGQDVHVAKVIGDAMANGALRRLEELLLQTVGLVRDESVHLEPHVLRGLREGRFDKLTQLRLEGRFKDDGEAVLAELHSVFDCSRAPRLQRLEIGDYMLYDRGHKLESKFLQGLTVGGVTRCLHVIIDKHR
jgi:hypothetical protein